MSTRTLSFAAGFALLVAAGCGGDKRAEVTGKVTLTGKGPLPGGSITFVSAADPNRNGSGIIGADGSYRVGDAPVGECKVLVDTSYLDPAVNKKNLPGMGPAMMPGMKGGPPPMAGAKGPPAEAKGKMGAPPTKDQTQPEMGKAESADSKFAKIDPSFSKVDSTTLTATVVTGANSFNFEVK